MDITDRRTDPTPAAGKLRLVNDEGKARILDSNGKRARLRAEAGTPVNAVAATATLDPTGTNNSVLYTAKVAGAAGNTISVQYAISGGGSSVLSVDATGNDILVTAGSATTAATVISIVNSSTASALVTAAASGTVTGVIAAVAKTYLAGGVDATEGQGGDMLVDGTNIYMATAEVTKSSTSGWRKVAHSAL
jgi:hypothetical protein